MSCSIAKAARQLTAIVIVLIVHLVLGETYRGYIIIMEKKTEATIVFRV